MAVARSLALTFHVPNGSYKSGRAASSFKAQGLRSGVPDYFIALPKGGEHGLFIELKTTKGTVQESQKEWLKKLVDQRYRAEVARGAEEAFRIVKEYIA